jgi:glycerophosphoryl diester phosphodiesterase
MKWLVSENGFVHVCAHRGHSVAAPENTLSAFEAAKEAGATTCEIDIVLTKDEDIVVCHDLDLGRISNGHGLIANMTLEELRTLDAGSWFNATFAGEPIPTLRETLEYAKGKLGLVIEIKERQRVDKLIEKLAPLLEETGMLGEVIIISFSHPVLVQVKERIPGVRTEGITHARHVNPVRIAKEARLDSLSVEVAMFHPDDAKALHEAGVAIRCHLPRPEELTFYKNLGFDIELHVGQWLREGLIDSLSGDDVAFLRKVVDSHRLEPKNSLVNR